MEADRLAGADGCLYLYGVFRPAPAAGENLFEGLRGVEEGCEVRAIACGDVAAAASAVPRSVYNQESLDVRCRELDWIGVRAARHEQVVRRLMQSREVIPLKFATLYSTEAVVREMLARQYEQFARLLDRVAGCEEWGVRIYAAAALVEQALERRDGETQALDRQIAAASAGQAYLLGRRKRRRITDGTRQWAAEVGETIYASLVSAAVEAARTRFLSPSPSPADLAVLSAALLVARDKMAAVKGQTERLEVQYREYGLRIELSGPWAPYNFCGERGAAS